MASTASIQFPSSSSSPAPPQNHGSSPSSNLYLVTFLATLFLLLFVSCAIVLRSYVLRQRYNRRINEAMAAGLFLAPRTQGSKRKRFGVRPKFVDTWIANGGTKWERITPLSAQLIMVKRRLRDGHIPRLPLPPGASFDPSSPDPAALFDGLNGPALPPHANANAPTIPTPLMDRVAGLFTRRHSRTPSGGDDDEQEGDGIPLVATAPLGPAANATPVTAAAALTPPAGPGGTSAPAGYKIRVEMLQVAVLVAMPSPTRSQRKNARLDRYGHGVEEEEFPSSDEGEDEGEDDDERPPLPELVLGVTRVRYPAVAAKGAAKGRSTPVGAAQKHVAVEEEELGEEEDGVLGVEDPDPTTRVRTPVLG